MESNKMKLEHSLSQFGWYFLLAKMTIHFMRIENHKLFLHHPIIIISFTKKEQSSTTRLICTTSPINKSDISFSNLIINYLGQIY